MTLCGCGMTFFICIYLLLGILDLLPGVLDLLSRSLKDKIPLLYLKKILAPLVEYSFPKQLDDCAAAIKIGFNNLTKTLGGFFCFCFCIKKNNFLLNLTDMMYNTLTLIFFPYHTLFYPYPRFVLIFPSSFFYYCKGDSPSSRPEPEGSNADRGSSWQTYPGVESNTPGSPGTHDSTNESTAFNVEKSNEKRAITQEIQELKQRRRDLIKEKLEYDKDENQVTKAIKLDDKLPDTAKNSNSHMNNLKANYPTYFDEEAEFDSPKECLTELKEFIRDETRSVVSEIKEINENLGNAEKKLSNLASEVNYERNTPASQDEAAGSSTLEDDFKRPLPQEEREGKRIKLFNNNDQGGSGGGSASGGTSGSSGSSGPTGSQDSGSSSGTLGKVLIFF